MDIGWPTNVQHLTHVPFDRFNGFMGLPVEFEVEIPGRVPSASASMFGISAESMWLSFDSKWNSVSTILLLIQERYSQEGLKGRRNILYKPREQPRGASEKPIKQGHCA